MEPAGKQKARSHFRALFGIQISLFAATIFEAGCHALLAKAPKGQKNAFPGPIIFETWSGQDSLASTGLVSSLPSISIGWERQATYHGGGGSVSPAFKRTFGPITALSFGIDQTMRVQGNALGRRVGRWPTLGGGPEITRSVFSRKHYRKGFPLGAFCLLCGKAKEGPARPERWKN